MKAIQVKILCQVQLCCCLVIVKYNRSVKLGRPCYQFCHGILHELFLKVVFIDTYVFIIYHECYVCSVAALVWNCKCIKRILSSDYDA